MFSHPSQTALIGFFLGLSLLTLLRNRLRLPTPVRVYLPYLWLFFLAFTLADLVEIKIWIWALAAGPLIEGIWDSESYLWAIMVAISIAMALTKSQAARVPLTAGAWLVQLFFIGTQALVLREVPVA